MKKDDLKKVIEKNFPDQVRFLQRLVQAESANPFTPDKTDPQAPIELEVAKLIEAKLKKLGLKPKRAAMFPEKRPNLIAEIKGKKGGPRLIFNGHMDTVLPSSEYSFNPFSGKIKNGRLFGLGACDMKASLACIVFMAKALNDLKIKLGGDLVLTFVIDEEIGSCSPYGTAYLIKKGLKGNAALVAEPMTYKISLGHRGRFIFKITTLGEAIHTGLSDWEEGKRGHNAIKDMCQIIETLADLKIPSFPSPAFLGKKSSLTFPTTIQGGQAVNIVPEKCEAYGDSRLLPNNPPDKVEKLIKKKLKNLKGVNFKLETIAKVWGVEIKPKEKIVQVLSKHVQAVLGKKPKLRGSGPSADAWFFIRQGIPAISGFGPDGGGVHSKDEWVDLESVKQVTEIFARTAISFLGKI